MVASPKIIQFLQISQVPQNISTLYPLKKNSQLNNCFKKIYPLLKDFLLGGRGGVGWGCLTRNNG